MNFRPRMLRKNKLYLPHGSVPGLPTVGLRCKVHPLTPDQDIAAPGEIYAMLDMVVTNPDGSIAFRQTKKAESFVANFFYMLYNKMNGGYSAYVPLLDTSGTISPLQNYFTNLDATAAIGITSNGILGGTDNTTPTTADFKLGALIAHGTLAGQLQYSAMTFGAPSSDASISQCTLTRNLANASGGAITVQEIGCAFKGYSVTKGTIYVLFLRDITGGITVNNGQTLTINYRPQASI